MKYGVPAIKNMDYFTNLYMREFVDDSDSDKKTKYNFLETSSYQAFCLAKNQKFEESFKEFENIEQLVCKENKEDYFTLVLLDTIFPKKAYLYYKGGNIEMAKYLTYKSISANQKIKIKKKSQLPTFIQIQQYHNLARIYFRDEGLSKGLQLSCKIVLFLLTQQDVGIKYLDNFLLKNKEEESVLKCNMIYQILFDIVQILKRSKNEKAKEIFSKYLNDILPFFTPIYKDEIILLEVLKTISLYSAENDDCKNYAEKTIAKYKNELFPHTDNILKLLYN